jgi:hypothetical protein
MAAGFRGWGLDPFIHRAVAASREARDRTDLNLGRSHLERWLGVRDAVHGQCKATDRSRTVSNPLISRRSIVLTRSSKWYFCLA